MQPVTHVFAGTVIFCDSSHVCVSVSVELSVSLKESSVLMVVDISADRTSGMPAVTFDVTDAPSV